MVQGKTVYPYSVGTKNKGPAGFQNFEYFKYHDSHRQGRTMLTLHQQIIVFSWFPLSVICNAWKAQGMHIASSKILKFIDLIVLEGLSFITNCHIVYATN